MTLLYALSDCQSSLQNFLSESVTEAFSWELNPRLHFEALFSLADNREEVTRRQYLILGLMLLFGLSLIITLRAFSLELVHIVVMNTVIQKAPQGYSPERIRATFEETLAAADLYGHRQEYLEELLRTSQRLEKIQNLDSDQLVEILNRLSRASSTVHEVPPP